MVTVIVTYDISNDAYRTQLQELLLNYGLRRIQRSTFKGDLNTRERVALIEQAKRFPASRRDKICIIRLCKECASLSNLISTTEESFTDESHVRFL